MYNNLALLKLCVCKERQKKIIEQGNFWATQIPLSTIYSINKAEKQ